MPDMFLKISGVDGESQDDKHGNEIDILAWSFGVSQSGSTHMGSGSGSGKAMFQDMSFTKWIDKASMPLMLFCANGKHIPEALLTIRKAGEKPLEYYKVKMENLIVSSVSTGGSGGEDRLTENVTLNFAKVEFEYKEQTDKGAGAAAKRFVWDIAKNTGSA